MAYAQANLQMKWSSTDGKRKEWVYSSTDAIATVRVAGYISDATAHAMNVRDLVWVYDTGTPTTSICTVIAITSGAADLSNGTAISETNSD